MGQTFGELDQYLDPGLQLTVRGKVYTVPLPSAALGLWCRRIAQTVGEVSAASTDEELREAGERASERADSLPPLPGAGKLTFEEQMLGSAYAEMIADDVPDPYTLFCSKTAYVWIISGEEVAKRFWEAGGRPERPGPVPNRADRRKTRTTSTGEASGTPRPGSTSGTTSRRRSRGSGKRRGTGGGKS